VRYYLEQRDPEFEPKMAEILCVYRQVALLGAERGEEPGVKTAPAAASPSSLTTRNPGSRRSVRPRRIVRHFPAPILP
jgi:hypothetical protein